jgi:hypothetical protein
MREEDMVVDELNRGVAVPALWVGSKIADVFPSCPIVFGESGREWSAADRFDVCQRIIAVVPHHQQMTRCRNALNRSWRGGRLIDA